jgi:hypothetical protein
MDKFKKIILGTSFIALALTIFGTVYAGSLTPPTNTVTPQSYTLDDIYNRLVTGANAVAHSVIAPSNVSPTFRTLTEIWDKIPAALNISANSVNVPVGINRTATTLSAIDTDLTPSKIKNGETIFGVTGTYTGSGTDGGPTLQWSQPFVGITRPGGAVEGFNKLCWDSNLNMPTTYHVSFIPCSLARDYVGTGPYSSRRNGGLHDNNGITIGAVEYCQYLNQDGTALTSSRNNYWRLPTRLELLNELVGLISIDPNPSELHNRFPLSIGNTGFNYWSSDAGSIVWGGFQYPSAYTVGSVGAPLGSPADWFYEGVVNANTRKGSAFGVICVK